MYKTFISALALVLTSALATAQDSQPTFKTQPAVVVQARSGIGSTIAKLEAGKDVTVAYFGGSITAANGWRPKTTAWLQAQYPSAKIHEVDAAIGGTGSDLGVYRCYHDVIAHHPDLVFVEFSVNDGGAAPEKIWMQMEGIVRQIWKANPKTDIVFTYTFIRGYYECTLAGECSRAASAMEQLAEFYNIPSINFCPRIAKMCKDGELAIKFDEAQPGQIIFSRDNVHPTDEGHELYLKDIQLFWEQMKKLRVASCELREDTTQPTGANSVNHASQLEKTFFSRNYENARLVQINPKWLHGTWRKLEQGDPLYWATQRAGDIWTSGTPGDTVEFKVKGTEVKIYDLLGPNGGQVKITVDGKDAQHLVPLFDSFCTYHRLGTLFVAGRLDPKAEHTVVITIDANQPDRKPVAFRLQDPEKELAEPKYQGTNVWFGSILIVGDVLDD